MKTRTLTIAGILLTAVGAVIVSAQAARGPATMDDLVAEIRALRADLKASAAATTRMQLLTARLSLQEQRITALANQRAELGGRLAAQTRLRADAERQVQTFDESENRNASLEVPQAELEAASKMFKQQLAQHREAELLLRTQDAELSAQIAAEQNRWQEFNARLDELERSIK